jgi:hypothetical protein
MKKTRDRCPSCHQKVAPDDFLCPNCELILNSALAPEQPRGEVSVVRRMLELPQRGLPAPGPSAPPPRPKREKSAGADGPTRITALPAERPGVPIVVASLDRVTRELTEFDAWVVSLIDGASDTPTLAKKAGLKELELRVVLETLHERMVVDFADEPLPDEPLFDAPEAGPGIEEDEPLEAQAEPAPEAVIMGRPTLEIPGGSQQLLRTPTLEVPLTAPPPSKPRPAPLALGEALAEVTAPTDPRGATPDEAFVAEPLPASPVEAPGAPRPALAYPGDVGRGRRPVAPPPAPAAEATDAARDAAPAASAAPAPGRQQAEASPPLGGQAQQGSTDPRIVYQGQANRKLLDALKQVKRRTEAAPVSSEPRRAPGSEADARALGHLQRALRLEQAGRFDDAVRSLEQSIAQSPDAPSLYNRLAITVMRERADLKRAEHLLQKAVDLAPDNEVYARNLRQVIAQRALRASR